MEIMKIAIYGANGYGKYIYNEIIKNENAKISVAFWIDNYWRKNQWCILEREINDLPVITEERFFVEHKYDEIDAIVIAIDNQKISQEITIALLLQGYESIYLALRNGFTDKIPVLDKEGNFSSCIRFYKEVKPELREPDIVNFMITDFCNLKCKRCANFSNLVPRYNYMDLNEFESYLIQLRKKFRYIFRIQLLGGEPLLNHQVELYVFLIRKYFPETRIDIVTNGLLILNIDQKLIEAMVSCGAFFFISQYEPTRLQLDRIVNFLEEKGINYEITEPISQFEKQMTFQEQDGKKAFAKRYQKGDCRCFTVKSGRMGCTFVLNLYANREYFNMNVGVKELEDSTIDIMNDNVDGYDIIKVLKRPTPICKFCNPEIEYAVWETGQPQKADWFSA